MVITKKFISKKLNKNKTNKILSHKILSHECKLLNHFRGYLDQTKNDWNYITPHDFYHQYYITNKNARYISY